MAIIADIVDGDIEHRDGVTTQRRVFHVESTASASGALWNAMTASGLPREGDPHPVIPNAKVVAFRASPVARDPSKFVFEATYSTQPAGGSASLSLSDPVEVDVSVRSVEQFTVEDREGRLMETVYVNSDGNKTTVTRSTARVALEMPSLTISVTKTVSTTPKVLNDLYGGRTNKDKWGGYNPGVILCKGFSGSTDSTSSLYRVTGEFLPATTPHGDWRVKIYTGIFSTIPADVRVGNGLALYHVYPETNLSPSGFHPW